MAKIDGKLEIVANDSYLKPDGGGAKVQLVMRNTPPGGDFAKRSAAATSYLTKVVRAGDGDSITANGDGDPQDKSVFLLDSAQKR